MAKTIHTILYDDVLDGSKIIEMDNAEPAADCQE